MNQKISSLVDGVVQKIGSKYDLHIDQISILSDQIGSVLSGKVSADSFVENIEEKLNTTIEQAIEIATDVNVEIFLPAREILLSGTQENSPIINQDTVSKEDLLSAIENPTPSEHPISIAQERPVEKTRPSSGDDIAHSFIGEKLATSVSLPSQKTVVQPEIKEVKKPTPTVDPYREPIN